MFSYEIVISSLRGYYSLGEGNMCVVNVQSTAVGGQTLPLAKVIAIVKTLVLMVTNNSYRSNRLSEVMLALVSYMFIQIQNGDNIASSNHRDVLPSTKFASLIFFFTINVLPNDKSYDKSLSMCYPLKSHVIFQWTTH